MYFQNPYHIAPNCAYLGSYAQDLVASCSYTTYAPIDDQTGGQEFDTDGYNIIVREDDTC